MKGRTGRRPLGARTVRRGTLSNRQATRPPQRRKPNKPRPTITIAAFHPESTATPKTISRFHRPSGFSVEPAEPQGGVGRFDPHDLVAIIYPGCRGRNAPRSPAALPRAVRCQAFSLKSRVLMDDRHENEKRCGLGCERLGSSHNLCFLRQG